MASTRRSAAHTRARRSWLVRCGVGDVEAGVCAPVRPPTIQRTAALGHATSPARLPVRRLRCTRSSSSPPARANGPRTVHTRTVGTPSAGAGGSSLRSPPSRLLSPTLDARVGNPLLSVLLVLVVEPGSAHPRGLALAGSALMEAARRPARLARRDRPELLDGQDVPQAQQVLVGWSVIGWSHRWPCEARGSRRPPRPSRLRRPS